MRVATRFTPTTADNLVIGQAEGKFRLYRLQGRNLTTRDAGMGSSALTVRGSADTQMSLEVTSGQVETPVLWVDADRIHVTGSLEMRDGAEVDVWLARLAVDAVPSGVVGRLGVGCIAG